MFHDAVDLFVASDAESSRESGRLVRGRSGRLQTDDLAVAHRVLRAGPLGEDRLRAVVPDLVIPVA